MPSAYYAMLAGTGRSGPIATTRSALPRHPYPEAMSAHEAMSGADTAWLHMDRPNNLMVISGALWFDRPLDWKQLREVVSSRLVERFPRFRQRVVESRLPLRGPHWEDDPDFDLDLHLHQAVLPAPGDRAALEDFLSDLIAQPLDRSRPLWNWYLIDGYGSGSAIVTRMHHCIADGIALARVLLSLTDSSPEAGIEPGKPAETEHHGGITGAVGDVLRPARRAASLTGTLAEAATHEAIEIARDPSELVDLAGAASVEAKALAKTLLPGPETPTVLKGHLGVPERVAWSDPIALAEVKAVGHAQGATVNDVLVAAVTGALRTYLAERDSLVDKLHAFVPFNLRPLDQPLPRRLGNRFGLVRLEIPVAIENPRERLEEVHRRMTEIKQLPGGSGQLRGARCDRGDAGGDRAAVARAVLRRRLRGADQRARPQRAGLSGRHTGSRRTGLGADIRQRFDERLDLFLQRRGHGRRDVRPRPGAGPRRDRRRLRSRGRRAARASARS